MSFIEFVGFVISLAAMVFLGIRRYFEERQKQLNPEKNDKFDFFDLEEEEEQELRPYKQQMQKNKPQQLPPLPPQTFLKLREVQKQQPPPTDYHGSYGKESAIQKKKNEAKERSTDSYEVIQVENISRAQRLIGSLKSPQEMVIIKEILDKPLSIRRD